MKPIVHLHSSSRYDRSAASLQAAATRYNRVADLVTYTEVEFEAREKAVRRANGTKFSLITGDISNANDSGISYRRDRFSEVYSEMFKATSRVYKNKGGRTRDVLYATIAVLEDELTGNRLVVAVVHTASDVTGDLNKKNRTPRTLHWFSTIRNVERRINQLARAHKADARLFVADFNIDFKQAWARSLIKSVAPTFSHTWKNLNFKGGTHGNRVIDATLLRGKLKVKGSAKLFSDDVSSDHRPYIETLVWS